MVAGAWRLLYVLPAGSEANVIYAAAGGAGDTDAAECSSPSSSAPSWWVSLLSAGISWPGPLLGPDTFLPPNFMAQPFQTMPLADNPRGSKAGLCGEGALPCRSAWESKAGSTRAASLCSVQTPRLGGQNPQGPPWLWGSSRGQSDIK